MPIIFKYQKFSLRVLLRIRLTFFANFSLALLLKELLIKKRAYVQTFSFLVLYFYDKNPRNGSTKERPKKGDFPLWMRYQGLLNFSQIRHFLSVNNY